MLRTLDNDGAPLVEYVGLEQSIDRVVRLHRGAPHRSSHGLLPGRTPLVHPGWPSTNARNADRPICVPSSLFSSTAECPETLRSTSRSLQLCLGPKRRPLHQDGPRLLQEGPNCNKLQPPLSQVCPKHRETRRAQRGGPFPAPDPQRWPPTSLKPSTSSPSSSSASTLTASCASPPTRTACPASTPCASSSRSQNAFVPNLPAPSPTTWLRFAEQVSDASPVARDGVRGLGAHLTWH